MAQPWDLQCVSGVNGDFETRSSEAQSKSEDRFSGFRRPPHRVPAIFERPVRREVSTNLHFTPVSHRPNCWGWFPLTSRL